MREPSRVRRFFRLPGGERWLALEAALSLGVARAAVLALPFRWIAPRLGRPQAIGDRVDEGGEDALCGFGTSEPEPQARQVALAIQRVSPHTPWQSNCLAQAIAGQWMLRRRGITSFVYLGVRKNGRRKLDAHAWLRSSGATLLGGPDGRYRVVGAFGDPILSPGNTAARRRTR